MATEQAPIGGDDSKIAGSDLRLKQYFIMKQTTVADTVDITAATTDIGFGVLQNDPDIGQEATVRTGWGSYSKVSSDGSGTAIVIGDWVGTDNAGHAIKKTTDKDWVLGKAEGSSSALGTIIRVRLMPQFLAV